MHGEEVGFGNDLIEREQLDTHLLGPVLGDERIVRTQSHPERLGTIAHELADPAQADDAEGLVGEFDAFPTAALPPALHQRGMRLGHVACRSHQQRHGVLGGGDDVALRSVDHHHAAGGCRLDVDVVEADTCATDHHQFGTGSEHVVGDVGCRADDQGVSARDRQQQFVGREPELHVDLVPVGAEAVEASFGDLFGDQDASHRLCAYRNRQATSTTFDEPFTAGEYLLVGDVGIVHASDRVETGRL